MSGEMFAASGDTRGSPTRRTSEEDPIPVVSTKQTFVASETTLLTDVQTYFADEKIQIPETDVSKTSKLLFTFR